MNRTVTLSSSHFETALKHGMELWWDGSTPTARLDQRNGRDGFTRFVNARIEGKLGEEAISRFLLDEYGIPSQVDYRIYGSYDETDHGDLQYIVGDDKEEYPPAVEFDVKTTKPYNQWLAIRREIFDPHPDDAPFILTKLSLPDDIELREWESTDDWSTVSSQQLFNYRVEQFTAENFPIEVELVGTVYPDEFTDDFDQGDTLYDPRTGRDLGGGLRRPNKGIHVTDIDGSNERWDRFVDEITDDYPIEYEGLSDD